MIRTETQKTRPGIVKRLGVSAAALGMAATAGMLLAPAPAQAHTGIVDVSRNGCGYWGSSDHGYAYTEKTSGSCSGWAYLRVRWNGNIGSWASDPQRIWFAAPGGSGLQVSDHKSCSTCSYKNIWHI
jgi:hypothetical protein